MSQLLPLLIQFKYLILFPLAAVEGPMVSFAVGFLVYTNYLDPVLSFSILLLGDIIPDSIYYYIGRFGNKRNLHNKLSVISKNYDTICNLWHHHTGKTMFFGKLAYGLGQFFLISAGLAKLPFRRFIAYALPITLFQFSVLMFLGYYLGSYYEVISSSVKGAELIIAVIAVVIIAAHIGFTKYAKHEVLELRDEEEESLNE